MSALDDKPFGVSNEDSSLGYKGVAIKETAKFEGSDSQYKIFEQRLANTNVSARQMQMSGHD
jgi:hypothetical protein